ncbi:ROK family transcriptional regulator [Sinomonas sp. ASV486]|uniref:ROK family transcriptional regulator n=1 Tax=Sinomonas sp. ASV486 TaxID=3051170 RepID=UPI0027DCE338|nr:ROK family transcriptional regulator [Sinomonas sp. ASV486]MDQ4492260.1 ROK family transcriptional regulator [Sinomonas sp. ASV486]
MLERKLEEATVSDRQFGVAQGAASHGRILELIRTAGGLSRQQLLSATGMSRATLYERLDALGRAGYVYEAEALAATGGRRSRNIRFDDRGRVILALALGQTRATASVADTDGSVLRSVTLDHDIADPAEDVLAPLVEAGQSLLASREASESLIGVGVGFPAPIEAGTGRLVHATTVPTWRADAAVTLLGGTWDVPLVVENDAMAAALGERSGDDETLVYVKVGTGIGCGIVIDGSILRGARGAAGSIGHIRMAREGPICRCGRHGCLAAFSSGLAISHNFSSNRHLGLDEIRVAAEQGDEEVNQILRSAADILGSALSATITTINPHRLVLGGRIGSLPVFIDGVRERVLTDVVERISDGLAVDAGAPDDRSAVRGLATLVMRKVFAPQTVDDSISNSLQATGQTA